MLGMILGLLIAVDSNRFYENDQWTVFENESDCSLVASYDGGTMLWVGHDYGLGETTFIISDPALKSVTNEKRYDLKLLFVKPSGLDEGWGLVHARGAVFGEQERGIRFTLVGNEALDDVAASTTLGLKRDEVVVESLSLSGSREAVAKLRECSRKVYKRNPSDPLAGAEK